MKILEINSCNFGSTGNIMLGIAEVAKFSGNTVMIACANSLSNRKKTVKNQVFIGSRFSRNLHYNLALITGFNGCFSYFATRKLLKKVSEFSPDIIHLHNLHNCYINLPLLFSYIKKHHIPVVWTLHDCWSFTGKCPYFTLVKCESWKGGCHDCPQVRSYPESLVDRSRTMWRLKKKWFTGVQNMTIVTPSQWLADLVKKSYLKDYPVKVIYNGIDLSVFKPTGNDFRKAYCLECKKLVLGVAFGWSDRKGYKDCLKLAKLLPDEYHLVLVGLSKEQIAELPDNILGIERTNSQKELAAIYSASDVFINTTYEDNYPTVNLEARACCLPIITYRTGGSPESAGESAVVIDVGDVEGMKKAVLSLTSNPKETSFITKKELSAEVKFQEYLELYKSLISKEGDILNSRRKYY